MSSRKAATGRFIFSWLMTFTLASLANTLFNQYHFSQVGVDIDLNTRLSHIMGDLLGLAPTYGIVICLTLILSFTLIRPISRWLPLIEPFKFPLAGAFGFFVMLSAMEPILEITLISGARGNGFYIQIACGLIGGLIFQKLTNAKSN